MGQPVIKAEVCLLGIGRWKSIAGIRLRAEGLLHAEDRLEAAEKTFSAFETGQAVVGLDPVAA